MSGRPGNGPAARHRPRPRSGGQAARRPGRHQALAERTRRLDRHRAPRSGARRLARPDRLRRAVVPPSPRLVPLELARPWSFLRCRMPDLATLTIAGPLARLMLGRPEARNALSIDLLAALHARLDELGALPAPAPHVLILSGDGKAFCAGMDLKEVLA